MAYENINGVYVWGEADEKTVEQMMNCSDEACHWALMADHHVGYSMPIGGVVAYENHISPSGVGFDIACGNKAVLLDCEAEGVVDNINAIMDTIFNELDFGVGRTNSSIDPPLDHPLFSDTAWDIEMVASLKDLAYKQLGTIGSGNHYVDLFVDTENRVWCGVHFGSRGLGHKIATHFIKEGGGSDGMMVAPTLLNIDSQLGQEYIACMRLAGRYAYAGRDWVCQKVANLLGATIKEEIHNHHNFAWQEEHFGKKMWVVRKGATPAFPGQKGFIGGSMGDDSYIIKGIDGEEAETALRSTVHGAGRVMSRTQAAGKRRYKKGKVIKKSEGVISSDMMREWVDEKGVVLRGGGTDESPHCYKRIDEVLDYHKDTIRIIHRLTPIGVAMAGEETFDPFKD